MWASVFLSRSVCVGYLWIIAALELRIMSLFKYKPPKKLILDERSITTLDSKHKELQTEFQHIEDTVIPTLEEEKKSLKDRLDKLRTEISASTDCSIGIPKSEKSVIEECLEIRDRIKEIKLTIKRWT